MVDYAYKYYYYTLSISCAWAMVLTNISVLGFPRTAYAVSYCSPNGTDYFYSSSPVNAEFGSWLV